MEEAPLYETSVAKGRVAFRVYAGSMLASICLVWAYRATHMPPCFAGGGGGGGERERWWVWSGLFAAELWFGFYWILTQSARWNPVYHSTFKDRLSRRYKEDELPHVDVFVCTADPTIEPPSLVISTVLSVMAYDYPYSKLSVYLSDDGCSDLTFYALLEASNFAKHWLPFSQKYKVEPRSPDAYFSNVHHPIDANMASDWFMVKGLFEEMMQRINMATVLGKVPEEKKEQHKGFQEWSSRIKLHDHQPIVQVIIDGIGRGDEAPHLPTLVYLSREKRPYRHHNFKAGAMNALIRVSSVISNGDYILNVDCDMFSNNSASIRDALCFFMDKQRGHQIGFVQYPQSFHNCTRNDLYASAYNVPKEVELPGLDGQGGSLYIGSGCFHRREALSGLRCPPKCNLGLSKENQRRGTEESIAALEERAKALVTSDFEDDTLWGREMGLKYGVSVEDVITGFSVQCKGWRSVLFNPMQRRGFVGLAPVNIAQSLVQQQRWGEGHLNIFFSRHCPFLYGRGKVKIGLQMAYSIYNLWAANALPTLYYVTIPSLAFFKGVAIFPRVSSLWFLPFAYVIIAKNIYSLGESLSSHDTLIGWWNIQRMWLFRRITSYLFATIDATLNHLGFSKTKFVVTSKVADDDVLKRHMEETIDFSATPPVFTIIIATVALFNLFCFIGGLKRAVMDKTIQAEEILVQFCLCGVLVLLNLPIYGAMLFRRDNGSIPAGVGFFSLVLALSGCSLPVF